MYYPSHTVNNMAPDSRERSALTEAFQAVYGWSWVLKNGDQGASKICAPSREQAKVVVGGSQDGVDAIDMATLLECFQFTQYSTLRCVIAGSIVARRCIRGGSSWSISTPGWGSRLEISGRDRRG